MNYEGFPDGILSLGVVNIDMPKSSAAGKKLGPAPPRKRRRVREDEQLYLAQENANGAPDKVLLPYNPLPKTFFSSRVPNPLPQNFVYRGSCENFLWHAKRQKQKFDLIFTSPPYNLGKAYTDYSDDRDLDEYIEWQEAIIAEKFLRNLDMARATARFAYPTRNRSTTDALPTVAGLSVLIRKTSGDQDESLST